MRILRFSCTGPCGTQPESLRNCSEVHLFHFGVSALPDSGNTALPTERRERLITIMRERMCPHIDVSVCQIWVGTAKDVACAERVFDALISSGMTHDIATQWTQSVLMDPEHVPDVVMHAMEATGNTEVLHRLVAQCSDLRHKPVGELHSLNETVPA